MLFREKNNGTFIKSLYSLSLGEDSSLRFLFAMAGNSSVLKWNRRLCPLHNHRTEFERLSQGAQWRFRTVRLVLWVPSILEMENSQ